MTSRRKSRHLRKNAVAKKRNKFRKTFGVTCGIALMKQEQWLSIDNIIQSMRIPSKEFRE